MNEVGVWQRSQLASGEWKLNKVELSKEGRYGNLPYELLDGCRQWYGNLPYELVSVGRLSIAAGKNAMDLTGKNPAL